MKSPVSTNVNQQILELREFAGKALRENGNNNVVMRTCDYGGLSTTLKHADPGRVMTCLHFHYQDNPEFRGFVCTITRGVLLPMVVDRRNCEDLESDRQYVPRGVLYNFVGNS